MVRRVVSTWFWSRRRCRCRRQFNGQKQAPVGALSGALAKLQANRPLRELREIAKGITKQLPENVQEATAKIDECAVQYPNLPR